MLRIIRNVKKSTSPKLGTKMKLHMRMFIQISEVDIHKENVMQHSFNKNKLS